MLQITIPLKPITKKNSQRIAWRWTKDSRTGKPKKVPYIKPSQAYEAYAYEAGWIVKQVKPETPIDFPVNVKCFFYMPTRGKCDLTNLLESVDDILVDSGVLADDNYTIIESHDGSRVFYDKDNPRTEIYIDVPDIKDGNTKKGGAE